MSVLQEEIRQEFRNFIFEILFLKMLERGVIRCSSFPEDVSCLFQRRKSAKSFFGTTLPARLEKFNALRKGPFFFGDKVSCKITYHYKLSETQGVVVFKVV